MKLKIYLFLTLTILLVASLSTLGACKQEGDATAEIVSQTDTKIVVCVKEAGNFATFLDVLEYLEEEGELQYEVSSGMLSSVNGKGNKSDRSGCWLIYTSDLELSNMEWGTTDYDGKSYGSAIFGIEALSVKAGEIYILSYDIF